MRKFWQLSPAQRGLLLDAGVSLEYSESRCGYCRGIA